MFSAVVKQVSSFSLTGCLWCASRDVIIRCIFVLSMEGIKYYELSRQFDQNLLPQFASRTHRRIRGDLIAMLKITHCLLKFPMASTFAHPTHKGLRGHAYKFNQQRCCTHRRQFTFTIRAVPFWNKLPTEIVNASSVKYFKTLLDAH